MACTNVNGSLVDRNVNFIFFIHLNYVSCVTYVNLPHSPVVSYETECSNFNTKYDPHLSLTSSPGAKPNQPWTALQ